MQHALTLSPSARFGAPLWEEDGVISNFTATRAPTATDDITAGFTAGSRWMWAAQGQFWQLRDPTANAAVWTQMDASDHPGYISGNWYHPPGTVGTSAVFAVNSIRLLLMPPFKQRVAISALGLKVIATVAGNASCALYAHNPLTGRPTGVAKASVGSLSTAAATVVSSTLLEGASVTFEPGLLHWMAVNLDNTTATVQTINSAVAGMNYFVGSATEANINAGTSNMQLGLSTPQAFGAWPDLTSAVFTEITTAGNGMVHFRAA